MIFVFLGPTLSADEAAQHLEAEYLPPAAQGDVLGVAALRPWAIGIIDGYFERVPAVWHKEILSAMTDGIHVLGAASMGALRAAELESFGMEGVGQVFDAFTSGTLEDDDEVAVAHSSAADGYRAHSEAMVDIRATLDRAIREAIVSPSEARIVVEIAKGLFYPKRHYGTIFEAAQDAGLSGDTLQRLRDWLPQGRFSQKRQDALALLALLRERYSTRPEPKQVTFSFQRTHIWQAAIQDRPPQPVSYGRPLSRPIVDELRLLGPDHYREHNDAALLRLLAQAESSRQGAKVTESLFHRTAQKLFRRRGLVQSAAMEAWLQEQDLSDEPFAELIRRESRLDWVRHQLKPALDDELQSELKVRGRFAALARRAHDKRESLALDGGRAYGLEATGLSEDQLLNWYFVDRLGDSVPKDLESYAADLDLSGSDVLLALLVREFLFVNKRDEVGPSAEGSRLREHRLRPKS